MSNTQSFTFKPLILGTEKWAVLTPWHQQTQRDSFLEAWGVKGEAPLIMLRDTMRVGCAIMKNLLVEEALKLHVDGVVILDDDCYPEGDMTLYDLIRGHARCLKPQKVPLSLEVTSPPSRGTPYLNKSVQMPVAASMGFWTHVGDYDALGQLIHGATTPMEFRREVVFGRYFPLCGMNLAFYPRLWRPWCDFIDVSRFDDIWMGWLFERAAYDRGYCFNLAGPMVRHSRQSNVWANLRDEARYLEENDTLWQKIATSRDSSYGHLRSLLPV